MFGTIKTVFTHWLRTPGHKTSQRTRDDRLKVFSSQDGGAIDQLPIIEGNMSTSQMNPAACCPVTNDAVSGLLSRPSDFATESGEFKRLFGEGYGYGGHLERVRRQEFRRLHGQVYLDYAGAALYSERQIQESAQELMGQLLCNPHSAPNSAASESMAALRRETLELLNADGREYDVVITSGATAALKLVAECFPWSSGTSVLAHPAAVHNSVLGMRGPALAAGAAVQLVEVRGPEEPPGGPTGAAAEDPDAAAAVPQLHARCGAASGGRGYGDAAAPCRIVAVFEPMTVSTAAGLSAAAGASPVLTTGPHGPRGAERQGGSGSGRSDGGPATPPGAATGPSLDSHVPGAGPFHLLALPVECNFTGDREPLLGEIVAHVRQYGVGRTPAAVEREDDEAAAAADGRGGGNRKGQWLVLLDAAKACGTAPPDLSAVPADFVVLSYYKIFGHPTGLGALVARKGALALLAAGKSYFGGGTVEVAVADMPYHVRRPGPPGLEDGTPPFTAVVAARHGFAFLRRLGGLPAVHRHACCLARWLATRLAALRHDNGAPVCVLYGRWCNSAAATAAAPAQAGSDPPSPPQHPHQLQLRPRVRVDDHGPSVAFNLRRPDGTWVGYAEVGRLAAMHGVHLRTGCFCNPGACAQWLGLLAEDVIRHHSAGHVCWDDHDLVDGRPTGSVRVSLGAVNTFADAYALLELIRRYFVNDAGSTGLMGSLEVLPSCPAGMAGAGAPGTVATDTGTDASGMSSRDGNARPGPAADACRRMVPSLEDPLVASPSRTTSNCANDSRAAIPHGARLDDAEPDRPARTAMPLAPKALLHPPKAPPPPPPPSRRPGEPTPPLPPASRPSGLVCGANSGVPGGLGVSSGGSAGQLSGILLYPVKSCAPQVATAWPVGPTGLLYDREWALVDDNGQVVTLKQCPRMALIRPVVGLTQGTLTIHAPESAGLDPLVLAIPGLQRPSRPSPGGMKAEAPESSEPGDAPAGVAAAVGARRDVTEAARVVQLDAGLTIERVQVCGDTVCSDVVGACLDSAGEARVRVWFSRVLGAPCRIVQQRTGARKVRRPAGQPQVPVPAPHPPQQPGSGGSDEGQEGGAVAVAGGRGPEEAAVGFANDGQYLLVSETSMDDLRARLRAAAAAAATASGDGSNSAAISQGRRAEANSGDDDLIARFRPNLVVSGFAPYEEDGWATVQVGPLRADVLGTCPRCELLQVDPRIGVRRGSEVLIALAQYRRRGGRVQFGVLLAAAAAGGLPPPLGVFGSVVGDAKPAGAKASEQEEEDDREEQLEDELVRWLRQRFGRLAVVSVGDAVVPCPATQ